MQTLPPTPFVFRSLNDEDASLHPSSPGPRFAIRRALCLFNEVSPVFPPLRRSSARLMVKRPSTFSLSRVSALLLARSSPPLDLRSSPSISFLSFLSPPRSSFSFPSRVFVHCPYSPPFLFGMKISWSGPYSGRRLAGRCLLFSSDH